jgi:hypothetical protein
LVGWFCWLVLFGWLVLVGVGWCWLVLVGVGWCWLVFGWCSVGIQLFIVVGWLLVCFVG